MEKKKNTTTIIENQILGMLAFFSISVGLWSNFRQLWLQDNGFNATQISSILSLASILCAICIFFVAIKISSNKLKQFVIGCLLIKMLNLVVLSLLNHTEIFLATRIVVMLDVILEKLIIISIYPFIATIRKNNRLYSKRKLVEYLFRDLGILIGAILIGKTIGNMVVDYNITLIIAIVFLIIAFLIGSRIKSSSTETKVKRQNIKNCFRYLGKNNILKMYLFTYFVGNVAMSTGLGLKMLMLTNFLKMSDSTATNYLLIIGLIADVVGILALRFMQPKSDYVTIMLKFGIRAFIYILAFLANNLLLCFIAITWSNLISTAYENVVDAPYINGIKNEFLLLVMNVRYMVGMLGEAIGLFFAGRMYDLGIQYILGLSGVFVIFQIACCFRLVSMRRKEKKLENKKEYVMS